MLAHRSQDCCNYFEFGLRITGDARHLQVTGPTDAQAVITTVIGIPSR